MNYNYNLKTLCDGFICEKKKIEKGQIPISALRSNGYKAHGESDSSQLIKWKSHQTQASLSRIEMLFWFSGDIRKRFLFFHILFHLQILSSRSCRFFKNIFYCAWPWVSGRQKVEKERAFTMTFGWDNFSSSNSAQPVWCVDSFLEINSVESSFFHLCSVWTVFLYRRRDFLLLSAIIKRQ